MILNKFTKDKNVTIHNCGVMLFKSNRFEEAIEVLESNKKDLKNFQRIRLVLAGDYLLISECYERIGKKEEALKFRKMAKLEEEKYNFQTRRGTNFWF